MIYTLVYFGFTDHEMYTQRLEGMHLYHIPALKRINTDEPEALSDKAQLTDYKYLIFWGI